MLFCVQALREVCSLIELQRCESIAARRRYDDELSKLRHEGAARMREAALERHRLLQQIEALSGANTSSDQAVVIYVNSGLLYFVDLFAKQMQRTRLESVNDPQVNDARIGSGSLIHRDMFSDECEFVSVPK